MFIVSTYIKERWVCGPSFVAVVQSADVWQRHDRSHFWRLNRSWLGRVLPQGEMRSRSVIVIQIRIDDATERAFVEHDHMVQALPPNGTNHPPPVCRQDRPESVEPALLLGELGLVNLHGSELHFLRTASMVTPASVTTSTELIGSIPY
jgi:hypothetical protein